MTPETAMEHWRLKRYISSHELAVALADALRQLAAARVGWEVTASELAANMAELAQVRTERDSLAAMLSVAQVAS